MLEILACYEGDRYAGDLSPFHPLNGDMDDAALRAFLIALYEYGSFDVEGALLDDKSIMNALLTSDHRAIAGGLVVVSGDYRLFPQCCCGLEDWQGWRGLKQGVPGPWLGHDPDAWIDTSGEKAVLHNCQTVGQEALEVSYEELDAAVDRASKHLSEFLEKLRARLKAVGFR